MSSQKVVETFDRWVDEGHDAGLEEGHGDVVRQVIESMDVQPGERILDLGCGTGWATRLLAQTTAGVQAIGVDASPRMIARADELHSFTIRARYDFCSFEALDFQEAEFDRVFSMEALYYASDLERAVAEAFRVLKPGGRIDVLVDFYKESPATEGWAAAMDLPLHWRGEAEWRTLFEGAGFEGVESSRVVDSRGPGDEASFEPDACCPDWAARLSMHSAGTLRIRAVKPPA